MSEKNLSLYRRKHLGYIFQMYNLIPNLTVRENIEVGAYLSDKPLDVDELLHTLGIDVYKRQGKILAVIEAKRTCADVAKGRQQAKLYADLIEQKQGRRPVVFLTNGFDVRICDNQYPERKIAAIYSKRDLEKLFNLRQMRSGLGQISIDKNIAGRYYQEAAIKACLLYTSRCV